MDDSDKINLVIFIKSPRLTPVSSEIYVVEHDRPFGHYSWSIAPVVRVIEIVEGLSAIIKNVYVVYGYDFGISEQFGDGHDGNITGRNGKFKGLFGNGQSRRTGCKKHKI